MILIDLEMFSRGGLTEGPQERRTHKTQNRKSRLLCRKKTQMISSETHRYVFGSTLFCVPYHNIASIKSEYKTEEDLPKSHGITKVLVRTNHINKTLIMKHI